MANIKEKTEIKLGRLLSRIKNSDLKGVERIKCSAQISAAKHLLVETGNHVGIIYISRFLDEFKRDVLFSNFIERHPNDYLFVLAFADPESESYREAEEIADLAYQQDVNNIFADVNKAKSDFLCAFLDSHSRRDDLDWANAFIKKWSARVLQASKLIWP